MQMEGDRNHRRAYDARSCTSLGKYPTQIQRVTIMGYLKGKSAMMIFERHANLKYKSGNRHFWCRGYFVDTVGKYKTAIRECIENQLKEDIMND